MCVVLPNILLSTDRQIYLKFPGKCPKLSINPRPALDKHLNTYSGNDKKRNSLKKFFYMLDERKKIKKILFEEPISNIQGQKLTFWRALENIRQAGMGRNRTSD